MLQVTTAPSLTALVSPAAVGVASVTSPQTLHDVLAVILAGMVRVALTHVCMAPTTTATQSVCATSLVTMVTAVTLSAPTWDIATIMASACAITRLMGSTVKCNPAHGATTLMACVHPMVHVIMRHMIAHVNLAGWVLHVMLVIAQGILTVMNVATVTSLLTRPTARTA